MKKYLAIDIGGTFIKYAIMTEEYEFLEKGKFPTIREPLEIFIGSLIEVYKNCGEEIDGIALSMPGILDSDSGFMYTGGAISCIANMNIVKQIQQHCRVPITVENDAKCAACAELWKGSLQECRSAIIVVCGTGIGGAIILDGKLIKGMHLMAGEFSYLITDSESELTENSMLGFNCGVPHMLELISQKTGIPLEALNGEKVFDMANEGDEIVIGEIRRYAKRLAIQICNCQMMFDPEKIAIGGGISVQPLLLQLIKEEVLKINKIYPEHIYIPDIVTCRFYNDANLIGALYVHLQKRSQVLKVDGIRFE